MRGRAAALLTALALIAGGGAGAKAATIDRSLIPKPRPVAAVSAGPVATVKVPPAGATRPRARPMGLPRLAPVFGPSAQQLRPRSRPGSAPVRVATPVRASTAAPAPVAATAAIITRSLVPLPRPATPKRVIQAAAITTFNTGAVTSTGKTGPVCGSKSIIGTRIKSIPGSSSGCGVKEPVRVTQISGVTLSTPAVIDCTTAKATQRWLEKGAKPAVGRLGGGLASMRVIASYSCRTRNSRPGAKISEHGKGKAIDIAGFTFQNGKTITVLESWGKGSNGKLLSKLHASACGPFGTVLGPKSDKYHRDHFHVDTASYRSGPYCK